MSVGSALRPYPLTGRLDRQVRGELRAADGDGVVPRAGRGARAGAPAAARQPHGRAALMPRARPSLTTRRASVCQTLVSIHV